MVRFISSVTVPHARELVWGLLSDWSNLCAWDVNITSSVGRGGGVAEGRKYDCVFSNASMKNVAVEYECVRLDPPAKCVHVGTARWFKSTDTITLEQTEGGSGTHVTAEFNLAFRGVLAPLSFLMKGAMQETGPVVMKDIEKFVNDKLGKGDGQ